MAGKRSFGALETRRSKTSPKKIVSRRARYVGPDGDRHVRSFGDKLAAEMRLVDERRLIDRGEWRPPRLRDVPVERPTLSEWAREYIESRTLAPSTQRVYKRTVRVYLDPSLGQRYVDEITVADVAAWHTRLKTDLRKRARDGKGPTATGR